MSYNAYSCEIKFIKRIDVSSNEIIDIEYKNADMEIVEGVYSHTILGRFRIGDDIEWDEEDSDKFKVLDGGVNILSESDDEEEECEECEKCPHLKVDEEDNLCHDCYHKTCEKGECYCGC